MNLFKAIVGLLLIFVYHIPRILYLAVLASYAYVFNKQENLTADPQNHLKRAKRLLKKRKNSLLLYAAVETRFALERMVQREILFAEKASRRMQKEYDPKKKRKYMSSLDKDVDYHQKIFLVNRSTGEKFEWGQYNPLDKQKVTEIQGRLGDILHPKEGIKLGISNDPWYIETRKFLTESVEYLWEIIKDSEIFFAYRNLDQFEMIISDEKGDQSTDNSDLNRKNNKD